MPEKELDLSIYTKSGKLRKRKPKKQRNYFTQETENAIIKYNSSQDKVERNKLFEEQINYSFHKLAENIIHTFKFYYTEVDNVNDLKHEVVTFLLEKLHLYKQVQGKAYSYFGTIAKRYLILYNLANYKKQKNKADVDEVDEDKYITIEIINSFDSVNLHDFVDMYVLYVETNLNSLFSKATDQKTVYAVLLLFKKRDTIEIFNKQALYIYIREMTGNTTAQVTKTVKHLKILYKKLFNEYYDTGYIKI
jgi:hypothetical protein